MAFGVFHLTYHVGFRVAHGVGLDAALAGTLVKRGEHARGVPFAYVRAPDGYLIELLP